MATGGPLTSEQLQSINEKVGMGVKEAERSLPSGMLAELTFTHSSVRIHATKTLWSYIEELKDYVALGASTDGLNGKCLFLVSKDGIGLLSEGLRQEMLGEDGLTPEGLKQLSLLGKSLLDRFLGVLGDAAGVSLQAGSELKLEDPQQALRPLAALDSSMVRGFVVDSLISLRLRTMSSDREGEAICQFIPKGGDLSKIVEGLQVSGEKPLSEESYRVLVVDDAPFMRTLIKKYLKNTQYEVVAEGSTGAEAIERYKSLQPDLVIMDIMMPDTGGVAAVRGILEADEEAKILMCSALSSKNMVEDALSFGAKGYVVKPFKGPDLLAAIEQVIS